MLDRQPSSAHPTGTSPAKQLLDNVADDYFLMLETTYRRSFLMSTRVQSSDLMQLHAG